MGRSATLGHTGAGRALLRCMERGLRVPLDCCCEHVRLNPGRRPLRHVQVSQRRHLASWAGLAPSIYESAGKRTPAVRRRGNKWLNAMLVEAAGSVGRMHGKNCCDFDAL